MLSFAAVSETAIAESTTILDASAFMSGAAATASAGAIGQSGETYLGSVESSTSAGTLGVAAQTTLGSATATFNLHQFTAFEDIRGAFGAYPDGAATATLSSNDITPSGKASIITPATTATTVAGTAEFDAKANITLDAATADADLTVNDLEDEDAQGTTTLSGVSATGAANWDTVNGIYAVQVVYLDSDFERKRCVNIVPYGNYKVYVTR